MTAGAIFGEAELLGDVQSIQAYAVYSPMDKLDVTASLLHIEDESESGDVYGLAANYDLSDMVYDEAGYLGGDAFGGDEDIFTFALGVNF